MIIVQKTTAATNADMLASTDLANIPADGQLDIFLGSTQADSTVTITGPGNEPIVRAQAIKQKTNGMPDSLADYALSLVASQGGHYVVAVTVVTAATIVMHAIFRSLDEL